MKKNLIDYGTRFGMTKKFSRIIVKVFQEKFSLEVDVFGVKEIKGKLDLAPY